MEKQETQPKSENQKIEKPGTHLIKKYANRRLYDTQKSAYITLEDLKQYVLNFIPFIVIDAKTKQDVTKSSLIQIIFELEATHNPLFTEETLEYIIRFYGNPLQSTFREYLEKVSSLFNANSFWTNQDKVF